MRASALTRRTALVFAAVGALAVSACNNADSATAAGSVPTLGKADAPVTVTEYASVTCGVCAAWDEQVWPQFKAKYVDTGLVKYELREMLTPPNQVSAAGWLIARCAPDDKYFDVVRAIYRGQTEMGQSGDYRGVLLRVAQSAGMTEQQFEQCVGDEDELVALNGRVEDAVERGVQGTPTFFINGKKHEGGNAIEDLDAALQPLVRGKRAG